MFVNVSRVRQDVPPLGHPPRGRREQPSRLGLGSAFTHVMHEGHRRVPGDASRGSTSRARAMVGTATPETEPIATRGPRGEPARSDERALYAKRIARIPGNR